MRQRPSSQPSSRTGRARRRPRPASRSTTPAAARTRWRRSGRSPRASTRTTPRRCSARCNAAYRTQPDDLLLCALALALRDRFGLDEPLVDLEGHGREDIFEDVDLTRTVGWFTSLFPVRLAVGAAPDAGAALVAVKEQLRAIPRRGIGYGLLRYLHPDPEVRSSLATWPGASISFNYVGRWRSTLAADPALLRPLPGPAGAVVAARNARPHALELLVGVVDDRLEARWSYSANLHERATVERLAETYAERLRQLVAHCLRSTETAGTPSDFPLWHLVDPERRAARR